MGLILIADEQIVQQRSAEVVPIPTNGPQRFKQDQLAENAKEGKNMEIRPIQD